jgi:hypothetical protein
MMFRSNNSTAILIAAVLLVFSDFVVNSINAHTEATACVGMTATENGACTDGSLPQLAVCTVPAQYTPNAGPDDAVYQACCPNDNLNGFLDNMICVLWATYDGNAVYVKALDTGATTKDSGSVVLWATYDGDVVSCPVIATSTLDSGSVVLSMIGTAAATATAIAATTSLLYGL